ncbi:hypothetical protein [Bernardetia sp.]|uniref:hypothetical protein n=1 Tax=Bernardetia sp. TaxID=1937974 RepID=UPI0025B9417E|nr:hypothetical protein [Bernardetia sp.]
MKYLSLIIFLVAFSSCSSSKVSYYEDIIKGTWYPDKRDFLGRIQFQDKQALYERQEIIDKTEKWKVRDTIKIIEKVKQGKNAVILILENKKNHEEIVYNAFMIENTSSSTIKTVVMPSRKGYPTAVEAKEAIQNYEFKHIKHQVMLSKKLIDDIDNTLKPLYEITREDYVKVIKKLNSMKEELDKYAEYQAKESYNSAETIVGKVGKELFRKELFLMGYNPYLDLDENGKHYSKKFKDDKEIQELMKEVEDR